MSSSNVVVIPFSWDILEEFRVLNNSIKGIVEQNDTRDVSNIYEWFTQPGLDPVQNCVIAQVDGDLIGYLIVVPELPIKRVVLEGGMVPGGDFEAGWEQLLNWGIARGRTIGALTAHFSVQHNSTNLVDIVKDYGFRHVRSYWKMRCEKKSEFGVDALRELSIRTFGMGDEFLLAEIQNASFSGQWGFCPNTPDQIYHRVHMTGASPSDVIFLLQEQEVVGYCWTRIEGIRNDRTGFISMIGVHPTYRGSGLGRETLLAGMDHLWTEGVNAVELEVDSVNDPAREMYLSVGYLKSGDIFWYERLLDG